MIKINSTKGISTVIVVVVIALVVCAGVYIWQNFDSMPKNGAVDEIKDESLTYSTDQFSFRYPSSYKVTEDQYGQTSIVNVINKDDSSRFIQIGNVAFDANPGPAEGMTQEQIDEFPKDVSYMGWSGDIAIAYFYREADKEAKDELVKIAETIELEGDLKDPLVMYNNKKYRYFIRYNPNEYNVTESTTQWGGPELTDKLEIKEIDGDDCAKSVAIIMSPASLEAELKDLKFRIDGEEENIKVRGISATKKSGRLTEHQPPCGNEVIDIVFEYNNNVFVVRAFKNSEALLNEILEYFIF
jgi:hypothetical protein